MNPQTIRDRCIDFIAKDLGINPIEYLNDPIILIKKIRTRIFELKQKAGELQ